MDFWDQILAFDVQCKLGGCVRSGGTILSLKHPEWHINFSERGVLDWGPEQLLAVVAGIEQICCSTYSLLEILVDGELSEGPRFRKCDHDLDGGAQDILLLHRSLDGIS